MATIAYQPPRLVGVPGIREPKPFLVLPNQNAVWRAGDILVQATTGTIVNAPSASITGSGTITPLTAPATSQFTVTAAATTGAPAATYYIVGTYTLSGQTDETAPSAEIVFNCAAGFTPNIVALSAGAPTGANRAAIYVGLMSGTHYLQNATKTTLTLGGGGITLAYPLTNYQGAARAATNASANILGLAQTASDANFFAGTGGSILAGQNSSQLGATNTVQPLVPSDAANLYVTGLGYGQYLEMNLINTQAFTPGLLQSTAGLTLDSTSGFFVVDPGQSNKIITIAEFRQGVYQGPTASGTIGDLGARVVVYFNSGLLNQ